MTRLLFHMLRVALGLLFFAAGVLKLADTPGFLADIYGYEIVDAQTGLFIALLLPAIEVVVGVLLVTQLWTKSAALFACCLSIAFVGAQAIAVHNGITSDCGCIDILGPSKLGYATLTRTFIVALACFVLWLLSFSQHPEIPTPPAR
jgi:uncharacterized membrane protein YphA (DoxX/SURF4 family)